MSDWYDRQGNLLTTADFEIDPVKWRQQMEGVEELLKDSTYTVVRQDYTPNRRYWVSTVWLGLDHNWGGGDPIIFETMVFSGRRRMSKRLGFATRKDYGQERYSTEAEAIKGHRKILNRYTKEEENGRTNIKV